MTNVFETAVLVSYYNDVDSISRINEFGRIYLVHVIHLLQTLCILALYLLLCCNKHIMMVVLMDINNRTSKA